jgi:hypothetical protein
MATFACVRPLQEPLPRCMVEEEEEEEAEEEEEEEEEDEISSPPGYHGVK